MFATCAVEIQNLLAGQQVVIAAALGAHLDRRGIEPGIGLGHGEARLVLAGDQRRQHAALLFVRAEHHDRLQAEDVHVNRRRPGHGRAGFGDRLHHDRGLGDAEPGAAVLLRHCDAEPAGSGQGGVQLVRKIAAAIVLQPVGVVELGTELADLVPNLLLLRAQRKIHRPTSPLRRRHCSGICRDRICFLDSAARLRRSRCLVRWI